MRCGNQRRFRDESGQVLVFATLAMVVLLGITGLALDVGHAYLVQRQLQASTDAAALAGALDLPDSAQAKLTAANYGPEPGKRNPPSANDNAAFEPGYPETKCVTAIVTGCTPTNGQVNTITVKSKSDVKYDLRQAGRGQLVHRPRHRHGMLPVLGEAARHHDRARPDGLHVPVLGRWERSGLHRPQQRAGRNQDLPAADESPVPSRRAGRAAAVDRDDAKRPVLATVDPSRRQLRLTDEELSHGPALVRLRLAAGDAQRGSTLVDRLECQQVGGGRTGYAGRDRCGAGRAPEQRTCRRAEGAHLPLRRRSELRRQFRAGARTATSRATQASIPPIRPRRRGRRSTRSATTSTE